MKEFTSDTSHLVIHEVTGGNTAHVEALVALMAQYFPTLTKFIPWIRERAARAADADPTFVAHQWLLEVNGEPVGFYTFDYVPARDCGLSLFMGIHPPFRNLSFGGYRRLAELMFALSEDEIMLDAQRLGRRAPYGLSAEIEVPELIPTYHRYGVIELPVVYYEPMFPEQQIRYDSTLAPEDIHYERVYLSVFPTEFQPMDRDDPEVLSNLVLALLIDFYGLPDDNWAVQRALESIRCLSN